MNNKGLISTYAHGALDYVIGLALLLAPNIFNFSDIGGAAEIVPRLLGIAILGLAVLTNYELGLLRVITFRAHRVLEFVGGLYLALSPFIHGFSTATANTWMPHVVVGAVIVLSELLTQPVPQEHGKMHGAFS